MKHLILVTLICLTGCGGNVHTDGNSSETNHILYGESVTIERDDVTVEVETVDGKWYDYQVEVQNHTDRHLGYLCHDEGVR